MGNETKWADVAHYYLKSGIKCNVYRGDLTERRGDCKHTVETFGIKHLRVAADSMTFGCVPILRHRDDMTEAEAREIWEIHFGKAYEIGPFNELEEPCKDEILNSATYGTRNRLNTELMLGNSLTLHWFISRGFDVFGLIESGQAIRKEMGNG